jgi:hypothetical protein
VTGARFNETTSRGFTKEQLYSTASYQQKNLQGIDLVGNDLTGWDFNAQDLRGATLNLSGVTSRNAILSDGTIASLGLASGETLVAHPGVPIPVQVTGTFLIAPSATFDLTDNAAIVDYTGDSPIVTVRDIIVSGRGGSGLGGTWTGTGMTSSTAVTANKAAPDSRSLGYANNAMLPLGPYTTFHGAPVDSKSVLIAYTRTGDANLDGVVNDDDVTIVGATYAPGVSQPSWAFGDFDYNGFVDDDDVTLLGAFYNAAAPPLTAPPGAGGVSAVPEPATVTLLCGMLAALVLAAVWRRAVRRA